MRLYRVTSKVRPLPGNPRYWDCQFGLLNVWLYADSPESAAGKAENIVDALPYERVGTESAVNFNPITAGEAPNIPSTYTEGSPLAEEYALRERLAKESGLSLFLIGVETGADEAGFEEAKL